MYTPRSRPRTPRAPPKVSRSQTSLSPARPPGQRQADIYI